MIMHEPNHRSAMDCHCGLWVLLTSLSFALMVRTQQTPLVLNAFCLLCLALSLLIEPLAGCHNAAPQRYAVYTLLATVLCMSIQTNNETDDVLKHGYAAVLSWMAIARCCMQEMPVATVDTVPMAVEVNGGVSN